MTSLNKEDKIFVAGHNGMVGSAVVRSLKLSGYGNILTQERSNLDLTSQEQVREYILDQKPDIVITHTAPTKAIRDNFSTSTLNRLGFSDTFQDHTSGLLQRMFEIHQPSIWIFGHFHKGVVDTINGTEFHCLPELGFIDI